jgi:hypothetical protein
MRPKTGEGPGAANPKILLAFQERIYLLDRENIPEGQLAVATRAEWTRRASQPVVLSAPGPSAHLTR